MVTATDTEGTKKKRVSPAPNLALILFGSPGSGKGTQSKFLVEWLGIPQISTGDMLRDQMRHGTEIGKSVAQLMRSGQLVSDDLVNHLVEDRVAQPDCSKGFILDGYPRTRQQAEVLMDLLNRIGAEEVVIHLVVDYNIIVSRMTGRRVCPRCGTLYNSVSRPPKVEGHCDLEGETLVVRDDDRESVVRSRLEEYGRLTQPLIDFFQATSPRMFSVDASQEKPEAVFRCIQGLIEGIGARAKSGC